MEVAVMTTTGVMETQGRLSDSLTESGKIVGE